MSDDTWKTSDMSTAAYVKMRGSTHDITLLKVERTGNNHFDFVFNDPKGHGRLLQVEFMNSEFRDYDAEIRSLKKLCYDGEPSRSSRRRNRKRA